MSDVAGKETLTKTGSARATTALIFILAVSMLSGCGQANRESNALEQISWLIGHWDRMNMQPPQTAFETWNRESPVKFSGRGVTLQEQDTVFVETLGLVIRDKKLYYVAEVSHNEEPVSFELTQVTDSSFVCENPDHDFPM